MAILINVMAPSALPTAESTTYKEIQAWIEYRTEAKKVPKKKEPKKKIQPRKEEEDPLAQEDPRLCLAQRWNKGLD